MNNQQLFIPKKCKVGSQLREGTYTGKLGYIIYHDGKVWRKEKSWEDWRQKEGEMLYGGWSNGVRQENGFITGVEPIEFDNEPTSGFVLNKKAGGYSTGWNHRQTYCRVYDPRGWEFEITIPNLLFILEESNCDKGKGLDGEFVYSWDGKDLVLLPVSSNDYVECTKYTNLQSKKIGKRGLKEGCTYLTSKLVKLTYLGEFQVFDNYGNYCACEYSDNKAVNSSTKRHVFANTAKFYDGAEYISYTFVSGLTSLKEKVSDEIDPDYARFLDDYLHNTTHSSRATHVMLRNIDESELPKIFEYGYRKQLYLKSKFIEEPGYNNSGHYVTPLRDASGLFEVRKEYSSWNKYIINPSMTAEELVRDFGLLQRVYENGFTINLR